VGKDRERGLEGIRGEERGGEEREERGDKRG
jgi:hypothetical protein